MQERRNSIADALELHLSCIKPSNFTLRFITKFVLFASYTACHVHRKGTEINSHNVVFSSPENFAIITEIQQGLPNMWPMLNFSEET